MTPALQLFVGLGNPGAEYAGHRHNVGFMALDALAEAYHAPRWTKKFSGELAEITVAGTRVLLLKPLTYMNRSGQSVQAACQFYKIAPAQVTVIHDDLDLAPATLRIKRGGGHGGHNGLRDIDAAIGKEYRRLRIGIGHPGHKDAVTPHVLSNFSKAEREQADALIARIITSFSVILEQDTLPA